VLRTVTTGDTQVLLVRIQLAITHAVSLGVYLSTVDLIVCLYSVDLIVCLYSVDIVVDLDIILQSLKQETVSRPLRLD